MIGDDGKRRAAAAADAEAAAACRAIASGCGSVRPFLVSGSQFSRLHRANMLRLARIGDHCMMMRRDAMMRMHMPGVGLCGRRHELNSDQNDHRCRHPQELRHQRHAE